MEIDSRLSLNLAKLGLFAIGGLAVLANRKIVKPKLKSPQYNKVSVQAEHVISHFCMCMMYDSAYDLTRMIGGSSSNILTAYTALASSQLLGIISEFALPKKPQFDQYLSNTVGDIGFVIYLLAANS